MPNLPAQNRIDAARLLTAVPELQDDLTTGQLNLTHETVLSQAMCQYEKEKPHLKLQALDKKRLLEKMKGLDASRSAVIVAQDLDLNLKTTERARAQKDESIRLEITLSKDEMENLKRVRELSSHQNHNASWAEVIAMLSDFYIAKKDPTIERPVVKSKKTTEKRGRKNDATQGSAPNQSSKPNPGAKIVPNVKGIVVPAIKRVAVPTQTSRMIFRRDHSCRWVDPAHTTG